MGKQAKKAVAKAMEHDVEWCKNHHPSSGIFMDLKTRPTAEQRQIMDDSDKSMHRQYEDRLASARRRLETYRQTGIIS